MYMNRGRRAVVSEPAETEFAAMFVPSWARANAAAMKKTPVRFPAPPSARNRLSRSMGFQMGSLYITIDEDDTMIPTNEVSAKEHAAEL